MPSAPGSFSIACDLNPRSRLVIPSVQMQFRYLAVVFICDAGEGIERELVELSRSALRLVPK
jgi:hypothetical protein